MRKAATICSFSRVFLQRRCWPCLLAVGRWDKIIRQKKISHIYCFSKCHILTRCLTGERIAWVTSALSLHFFWSPDKVVGETAPDCNNNVFGHWCSCRERPTSDIQESYFDRWTNYFLFSQMKCSGRSQKIVSHHCVSNVESWCLHWWRWLRGKVAAAARRWASCLKSEAGFNWWRQLPTIVITINKLY